MKADKIERQLQTDQSFRKMAAEYLEKDSKEFDKCVDEAHLAKLKKTLETLKQSYARTEEQIKKLEGK